MTDLMPGGPDPRDDVERIRLLYCETDRPISFLLREAGIVRRQLYALVRRERWPLRSVRRRAAKPAPTANAEALRPPSDKPPRFLPDTRADVSDNDPRRLGPVDRRAMATRLERFIASRIADFENEPAPAPADGERQARTLNQLARTATAIRTYLETLKEDAVDDDAPPPRSLSELRDELRGHLERIRDEERIGDLRGGPEPP